MIFPNVDRVPRHPSQLYEFALEGLALFALLWWFSIKPRPRGALSALFLIGYGVFRFSVEYTREPDSHLGLLAFGLSMGTVAFAAHDRGGRRAAGVEPSKRAAPAGVRTQCDKSPAEDDARRSLSKVYERRNRTGQLIRTGELMAEDLSKRRFLLAATTVAGGAVVAGAAVPFVASMLPSERAKAGGAPVQVDIGKLEAGAQLTAEWRGSPVWILHRTEAMLKALENPAHREKLADPDSKVQSQQPTYARNVFRSLKPEYLVLVPVCTHLGCVPSFRPDVAPGDLGPKWPGGYYCPCHGSKFDFAGRVYRNVPAPANLVVPPHHYASTTTVRIGEDPGGGA